ncbi:MAG: xanthine dehydrogenase family protein subunit M [Candidatus Binataceae bacterium]|jgi:carbon-monoxide dehydrogenase medium subunit
MRPRAFSYSAPATITEAVATLQRFGGEARVLAGGQSLVPMMKLRVASPQHIVDINRISGLDDIRVDNGKLVIGTLATHDAIENSPLVRAECPLLAETAGHIADPLVRNRGTIGGSLCHADPAADFPLAAIVLKAELIAQGPKGTRTIAADDFFVGFLTTALAPDEILTAIRIPRAQALSGGAHMKVSRRTNGLAMVAAAAAVVLDEDGHCMDVGVCVGAMGLTPIRAKAVENEIRGKRIDEAAISRAAELAIEGTDPPSDIHGSAKYRLTVAPTVAARVLQLACERAGARL